MKQWIVFLLLLLLPANIFAEEFPELAGWTPDGEINIHRKNDLWEYINGGAELFLMYDFQMLRFREFSKGNLGVTVEIYDMGAPLNAFGIYTTERGDDLNRLTIGTEAVLELPYYGQLLKDRFYVKIKMYQGKLDNTTGEGILRSIDSFLKGSSDLPSELNLLPARDKILGSEKYTVEGYMGLGELNHILFADYQDRKKNQYRFFFMLPSPDETLENKWQALSGKWKTVIEKGHTILYRDIPYSGKIGVVRKDNKIIGISHVSEMEALLKRLTDIPQ